MTISRIYLNNFKGFSDGVWIGIKPITIFFGANSSGKSSCIHALACLSQTVKVSNNRRPLILDDEYVNVHLGRFIEAIHSRSYDDSIGLGLSCSNVDIFNISRIKGERKVIRKRVDGSAVYNFKCTRRTQGIRLENANFVVGDKKYEVSRDGMKYRITSKPGGKCFSELGAAFLLDQGAILSQRISSYEATGPLFQFQRSILADLSSTYYLGPFRPSPQRRYPTRGASPIEVGPMGESTVTMLANEIIQTRSRTHITQIAKWLNIMGLGKELDVNRLAASDMFDVNITLPDGKKYPIADLGYGLSQALPVLTQCSFAKKGCTLLFEQPEIHLHYESAKRLATVFTDTVVEKKCNIVIETHSPELIKQFIQEAKKGKIKKEDIAIYKIERDKGQSVIRQVNLEEHDGDIEVYDNWEREVSSEY